MPKRNTLNNKRLSKSEVNNLIRTKGTLHEEFSKFFEETYASGHIKKDLVYELDDGSFLYVFDQKEDYIGGKGDIYPKEYFFRWVDWAKRVKKDYSNGRGSSVEHWHYYSTNKGQIINRVDELISDLVIELKIETQILDRSYKSLDIINKRAESYGAENLIKNLYDNLICYVGEVLKRRVKGEWKLCNEAFGINFPYIDIGNSNVKYMPINVVWSEIGGLNEMNFRTATANEVRRHALRR